MSAVNTPDDLRYTTDHEWACAENGAVKIGITDFAQDALGDVVFIQLPDGRVDGRKGRHLGGDRVDEVGLGGLRAGLR